MKSVYVLSDIFLLPDFIPGVVGKTRAQISKITLELKRHTHVNAFALGISMYILFLYMKPSEFQM